MYPVIKVLMVLILCIILFVPVAHSDQAQSEDQERIIIQTPFKPIKAVYPGYPEILRKEGVAARVRIFISIDKKANVRYSGISKSIYPELRKNLKAVFKQWQFEPFIYRERLLKTFGYITVIFYPDKLSYSAQKDISILESIKKKNERLLDEKLQMVLDKCTEYCLKLSKSALYYVCHEKIREKSQRIKEQSYGGMHLIGSSDLAPNEMMRVDNTILTLADSEKHAYINDCQLIQKEGNIIEKVRGNLACVIELQLVPGQKGNIKRGRIWVSKLDFRVVKTEIETDFLEGCEDILEECDIHYLKPHFKSTHYYDVEKNGLLFPSRSEIRIEYSGLLLHKKDLKSKAEITYSNYRFFTVDVDHDIIKKLIEKFFCRHHKNRLTFEYSIKILPDIKGHFNRIYEN